MTSGPETCFFFTWPNRRAAIHLKRRSGKQAFAATIAPPLLRLCLPMRLHSEYLLIVATGQLAYDGGATTTEGPSLYGSVLLDKKKL